MTIILTGSQGQVGQEIQDLALHEGISIAPFSRENLDISHTAQIQEKLSLIQNPSILVNAAAYTAVDLAEDEPEKAYAINAKGVENLAIFCKKVQIPMFHISTDYVFSGEKKDFYKETDEAEPSSEYGRTKLAGEKLLQDTLSEHIILRVSWVFGQYGKNFVKTIVRLAKERDTLKIVDDQVGNPTAAADIARVIIEIYKKIKSSKEFPWGIYHYCGKNSVSWYQFASTIIEEAKKHDALTVKNILPITTQEFPTKAIRPKNSRLNCDKITTLGIEQKSWEFYLINMLKNEHKISP